MRGREVLRLVLRNTSRSPRQFALSSFGIVIGIGAYVFFLGLSMGVRNKVLELFPPERVEVIAPQVAMVGVDFTQRLSDSTVSKIREAAPVSVDAVVPRLALAFPAMISGYFDGARISLELIGDGIDPGFLADDGRIGEIFKDYEVSESGDRATCGPPPKYRCKGLYYCDKRDMTCRHRVPVIVSPFLLEFYNSSFANSHKLPAIGAMEEFIVQRGGLEKMRLYIDLGSSMISGSNNSLNAPPRRAEGVLLGISDKAIDLGATLPIQYVKRWNAEYVGEEAAGIISSIIVTLGSQEDVARFSSWLKDELGLEIKDSQGERLASIITTVTLLFLLIALVIVVISAINISHNFFMQVAERRREIGLMRAIGATRSDVRNMFIGEAAVIGLAAGLAGIALGVGLGVLGDIALSNRAQNMPFKPDSFFDFDWWIALSGLGVAVFFSVVGGALPARKAARMQPAQALVQR